MEIYKSRFVICVLKDGVIQKELANDVVPIQFGSEYSLRIRNHNNKRAVCKLYIDGENVSGGGFIIGANSHVDIERPANVSKKFKFVSLDSEEAYEHGKNGSNSNKIKGVIYAEFALEKEPMLSWDYFEEIMPQRHKRPYRSPYTPWEPLRRPYERPYALYGASGQNKLRSSISPIQELCESDNFKPLRDGATVEGSRSEQNFQKIHFENENNWTVVKLFLQGYDEEKNHNISKIQEKHLTSDEELKSLENELLDLQKMKLKKEIEKLKKELS